MSIVGAKSREGVGTVRDFHRIDIVVDRCGTNCSHHRVAPGRASSSESIDMRRRTAIRTSVSSSPAQRVSITGVSGICVSAAAS